MSGKTAVILMNLGGPDNKNAIRPFLMNFFMDKNVVRLPLIGRYLLASLIAWRRSKKEAGQSYGELGDKSPLLANTQAQANALQKLLGDHYSVHVHMRYWHPMADQIAYTINQEKPDHIILLPLYPQYSTTTTRSSVNDLADSFHQQGVTTPVTTICCYPFDDGFIQASAALVRAQYEMMKKPRVLFSAHGLPVSIIKDGDPYQWQCEESARLIAEATGIENLDWQICYQSRVGAQKWLQPSTEQALHKAANDGKGVLIYPHAFVSEHVETLVELDIEYREVAEELGIHDYDRVPTVSVNAAFIKSLAEMVKNRNQTRDCKTMPNTCQRLCPLKFKRCAMDVESELKGFTD